MKKRALFLFSLGILPLLAQHAEVLRGEASFSSKNKSLLIQTHTNQTHLKWKNFHIPKGETVHFLQPSALSAVLNQVTQDPSHILGNLESNGKVFLLNPNGIVIGKEAKIRVGEFMASTLPLVDVDAFFEQREMEFSHGDSSLIHLGSIEATSGDIYLLSQNIQNKGELIAPEGEVHLGAGDKILLRPGKSGKFLIVTDASSLGTIDNSGKIKAKEVTLKARNQPYSLAINHTGTIEGLEGKVSLEAENAQLITEGEAKITGKEVALNGHEVYLKEESSINASTKIAIGETSRHTYVGENVKIVADAPERGNGGDVLIWSDGVTGFYGKISARGGALEGDGGNVEVSGRENLDYRGLVDMKAPFGKLGSLLLDPSDITISGTSPTSGGSFSIDGVFTPSAASSNIYNEDLYNQLDLADVTINTASSFGNSGDITFTAAFSYTATSGGGGLTLIADNDIIIDTGVAVSLSFALVDDNSLSFSAANDVTINGNLTLENLNSASISAGNDFAISTASDVAFNNIVTTNLAAGNDFFIDNSSTTAGNIQINTGDVNIAVGNDFTVLGQIENFTIGDIAITVGNDFAIGPSSNTSTSGRSRIGTTDGIMSAVVGNDFILTGSSVGHNDNYAQFGIETGAVDTDIYLTVGRDLFLIGGTNSSFRRCFALIGHGGANSLAPGLKMGDIIISEVGGNAIFTPGTSQECFAQIGHSQTDDKSTVILRGDIRGVTPGSYARILGDLMLMGGSDTQCYSLLGHGGSNSGSLSMEGDILVYANNIHLQGGTQQDTPASIGFRVRFNPGTAVYTATIFNANVKVKSDQLITLIGGDDAFSKSGSGAASIGAFIDTTSSSRTGSIDLGVVDIQCGTQMTCLGGLTAPDENFILLGTKSLDTTVSPPTITGTSKSDLNINVKQNFSAITRNGESIFIQNGDTPTAGRTFTLNSGGDIFMMAEGQGVFVNAIDTANITSGRNMSLYSSNQATEILAQSDLNVRVGKDLLQLGHCVLTPDIYTEALIHNLSGDLLVIAGRDINLEPFGRIRTEGSGVTTVVVDNDYPTSPEIGPGSLYMNVHSRIGRVGGVTCSL